MAARGKSINLFLMDGTATGRVKCTLANWTGVAYKISLALIWTNVVNARICRRVMYISYSAPRSRLAKMLSMLARLAREKMATASCTA